MRDSQEPSEPTSLEAKSWLSPIEEPEPDRNLMGDDPEEVSKQEALSREEEEKRKEEQTRKEIQKAVERNMNKQANAMSATMAEIMNGGPAKKGDDD